MFMFMSMFMFMFMKGESEIIQKIVPVQFY